MKVSQLCTPALIYFILSFIYLIMTSLKSFNIMYILMKVFFIMLWAFLLNLLCTSGYSIISWIILILPFFVM